MINKLVTSKSGRKFRVDFVKDREGIVFEIRDVKTLQYMVIKISHVTLVHLSYGDDYVLILKHEIEKFEYCLNRPKPEKLADPSVEAFCLWDGNC